MNEITRLPKGHRVIAMFPLSCKSYIHAKGVSTTEDDDKLYVEAFVAGDTPSLGLSIVALDNPEWCLFHGRPEDELRHENSYSRDCISRGYDNYCVINPVGGSLQSCPY